MANNLTESKIMDVLNWSYDKAVQGVAGLDSAYDLADAYLKQEGSLHAQVNSLIRWQNTKAGTSGFLTGLGGIITLPVAIPANVASVMYVQIRMIAAIAHMGGYNLNDDRVKSLVFLCLTGNAAKDILKDVGIVVGKKLAENAIKNISGKTIVAINKKVGFRLLTKFGEKGVINLGKAIPLLGGVVGATFDSVSTNTVGNIARDTFINKI
ncbi:EcsC family protein [Acinetobacter nosocomialis]|uniref:EcsC family protein n=1 Tax=Acinetobacter nosocomialis TaxID=106654 RepID=UPI003AF8BDDC